MKKNNLWSLLALLFCLTAGMTLTACGSDDDDEDNNETPTGGSVVGTWVTSEQETNPNASKYDYKVKVYQCTYEFKSNGTFRFQSDYYGWQDKTDDYDGLASLLRDNDIKPTAGLICEDLFRLRYTGSYTISGSNITMTFKKWWMYDYGRNGTDEDRWGGPDGNDVDKDAMSGVDNPLTVSFSVNGNTLKLGNAQNGYNEYRPSGFYEDCKMLIAGTLTKK